MGQYMGTGNVADDDEESLVFADEGEDMDDDGEDEEQDLATEIAWMIADTFGRSAIDADFELAAAIIEKVILHPLRADTNS